MHEHSVGSSVCFCTLKPVVQTALCYTSLLCFSSLSRAPPHIRSQRKRRNISTKTEMYVKAQTAAHMAQTELVSVCFILVLDSQRNGCDDEYSVISDRVSSCVSNWLKHSSWCGGEKGLCSICSQLSSFCQSSRLSDESRVSRSRLDLTVRAVHLWSMPPNSLTLEQYERSAFAYGLMSQLHLPRVKTCLLTKNAEADWADNNRL